MHDNKKTGSAQDAANSATKTIGAAKKTSKAISKSKKAAKLAVKASGKLISAFGIKALVILFALIILLAVLTNGVPATSFNSFTHVNESQLNEDEINNKKSVLKDLESAKKGEEKGLDVIAEVFREQKKEAYDKLEALCKDNKVDFETSLQFLDSNFVEIGSDMFNDHQEGFYTEEEYDAMTILSAYSISVDNLLSDKNVGKKESKSSSIRVSGNVNKRAKEVYDILIKEGCTPEAACGILGNIMAESAFKINAVSKDGYNSYGLCQWTGKRKENLKKYCSKNGYRYDSLEGQAHFIMYEIFNGGFVKLDNCNFKGSLRYLRCSNYIAGYSHPGMKPKDYIKLRSIEKAAVIWINHFERPASGVAHNEEKRIAYAKGFYDKFAKNAEKENIESKEASNSDKKHWTNDMSDKLSEYLSGKKIYTISADVDENGDIIRYEGIVDKNVNEDLSDAYADYSKVKNGKNESNPSKEKIVDREKIEKYLDQSAATQQEAMKAEVEEVNLTKKEYIKATVVKESVEELAMNAFGVTDQQVKSLYSSTKVSAKEIIRSMSYNSLALLHDVSDPENDLINKEDAEKSYDIGADLGKYRIDYYCGCDKKVCTEHRKKLVITDNGALNGNRKRVKGVSCAAVTKKIPHGTILELDGYGLLVVDDVIRGENDKDIIAIYTGKSHDAGLIRQIKKMKNARANLVTGITQATAKSTGRSSGSLDWPLGTYKAKITSPYGYRIHPIYGYRKFHSGIDLGAPYNTPITASDGGKVILAGYNGGYGNCIILQHDKNIKTLYAHCSKVTVKKGQAVGKGQVIGKVGSTGNSTGPHLHFEVIINGATTDPQKYIRKLN